MQEHTRQRILLVAVLLVALLLGAWWYSGFSLDFMRFFAAEPGVTDNGGIRATAPPGCYYQEVQCIQAPCDPILVCNEGKVKCEPTSQTVKVGTAAVLLGAGGDGTYEWFSPDGTPTTGSTFSGGTGTGRAGHYDIVYATAGTKQVTVQSKRAKDSPIIDSVACTVIVQP